MVFAVKLCDVNIFIYAHREENDGHLFYHDWLTELLEVRETFLFCEWVLSAFVRIVTHPRIYRTPTPLDTALKFANTVRTRPNGISIMPGARHWQIFERLCNQSGATGNLIPDAYLAALAIEADAQWVTADQDFAKFSPELNLILLKP